MTRNDSHELHTLPQTDPAPEPSAPAVLADAGSDASGESAPAPVAEPTDAPVSFWMRVLAWLPLRLWTDCGVCLFWRGAVVGAFVAGALATVVSVLA